MDVATKIAPFTFENMFESLTKWTDKKGPVPVRIQAWWAT
jgi:hypothetical protein